MATAIGKRLLARYALGQIDLAQLDDALARGMITDEEYATAIAGPES